MAIGAGDRQVARSRHGARGSPESNGRLCALPSLRVALEGAVAADPNPLPRSGFRAMPGPPIPAGRPGLWRVRSWKFGPLAEAIATDIADWATLCVAS